MLRELLPAFPPPRDSRHTQTNIQHVEETFKYQCSGENNEKFKAPVNDRTREAVVARHRVEFRPRHCLNTNSNIATTAYIALLE